jgi:lipid II:glycine glycyltransferase (peptidoglycan interpeptide bridge formation enzyme)
MHQKGRYNIKVAEKNGVTVQESKDIDAYYELAKKTAGRDGFGIPSKKQLQAFIEKLPGSFLLLAYSKLARPAAFGRETRPPGRVRTGNSKPIAGIIGIIWGNTGIYYYGASDYEHRNLMAPYLLQWEAIKRCKAAGCTRYDLLGIAPQATSAELRATSNDISRSSKLEARSPHPWAGISDFKAKFGGTVITYPPEQEIVLKPIIRTILLAKRAIIG